MKRVGVCRDLSENYRIVNGTWRDVIAFRELQCEWYNRGRAGVTQLAECLLPKQNVVGSNPITRSSQAGE